MNNNIMYDIAYALIEECITLSLESHISIYNKAVKKEFEIQLSIEIGEVCSIQELSNNKQCKTATGSNEEDSVDIEENLRNEVENEMIVSINTNNNILLMNDIELIELDSDDESINKKRRDIIIKKDTSDILHDNYLNKVLSNNNDSNNNEKIKYKENITGLLGNNEKKSNIEFNKTLISSNNSLFKKNIELQPNSPTLLKSSTHTNPRHNTYKSIQNNNNLNNQNETLTLKKSPILKSIENKINKPNNKLSENENKLNNDFNLKDPEVLINESQEKQNIRKESSLKQINSNLLESDSILIRIDDKITDDLFSEYIHNKEAAKQYTNKAITIKEAIKKRSLELRSDALKRRSEYKSAKNITETNNNNSNNVLSPRAPDEQQQSLKSHLTEKRKITSNKELVDDDDNLIKEKKNYNEKITSDNETIKSNITRFAGVSFIKKSNEDNLKERKKLVSKSKNKEQPLYKKLMEEAISNAIEIEKQKIILREKKKEELKYSKSPSKSSNFISKIDNLPKNLNISNNNLESFKIVVNDNTAEDIIFLDHHFDNLFPNNETQKIEILQSNTVDRKKKVPLFKRMEQEGKEREYLLEKEKQLQYLKDRGYNYNSKESLAQLPSTVSILSLKNKKIKFKNLRKIKDNVNVIKKKKSSLELLLQQSSTSLGKCISTTKLKLIKDGRKRYNNNNNKSKTSSKSLLSHGFMSDLTLNTINNTNSTYINPDEHKFHFKNDEIFNDDMNDDDDVDLLCYEGFDSTYLEEGSFMEVIEEKSNKQKILTKSNKKVKEQIIKEKLEKLKIIEEKNKLIERKKQYALETRRKSLLVVNKKSSPKKPSKDSDDEEKEEDDN